MNLETEISGIKLAHPLMNAGGTCKTLDDLKKLLASETAGVEVGSITVNTREGNLGQNYFEDEGDAVNSIGLRNGGRAYYEQLLPQMVDMAHDKGKPLFANVAGESPEEYGILAELVCSSGADALVLNFGCPNVLHGNRQKRPISYDPVVSAEALRCVKDKIGLEMPIIVKESLSLDYTVLVQQTQVVRDSGIVKAVLYGNTAANAFLFNGIEPALKVGNGLGGYSGKGLRPMMLGQVRQIRELLPPEIQIIGCGGITKGQHIWEFLACGASVVQIATHYLKRRERVFSELLQQYVEFREAHGV